MRNLILASLLGLIGLFLIAAGNAQAAPPSPTQQPILGDVTCDHEVNAVDALTILRISARIQQTASCATLADVNCDQSSDVRDSLTILRYAAGFEVSGQCHPGQVRETLVTLKPGASSATVIVPGRDPIGDIAVRIQAKDNVAAAPGQAVPASWSNTRFCQGQIWDVGTGGRLWSMTLNSNFSYNYSTLWENSEWVSTYAAFPYSWSNKSWWSSSWGDQYMFADGIADLKGGVWWFSINVTKHIFIQQDAWGNCSFGWYNG